MADVVPSHGANLAFVERVIQAGPVDKAGLRFDDPEIVSLEAAHRVMTDAVGIGIKMPGTDVIIPGDKGKRVGDDEMIETVETVAHKIPRNELTHIDERTHGVNLILLIAGPREGDEAFPVEHQAGVVRDIGDGNFRPVVVSLAPIRSG